MPNDKEIINLAMTKSLARNLDLSDLEQIYSTFYDLFNKNI